MGRCSNEIAGIVLLDRVGRNVDLVFVGCPIAGRCAPRTNSGTGSRVGLEETTDKTVRRAKDRRKGARGRRRPKTVRSCLDRQALKINEDERNGLLTHGGYENDPETDDWDSSVLPAGAVGVLSHRNTFLGSD